ncbi:MAG: tRNA guanosine(34) transglycosylase Tgt [Rhodothermales bacterium]|nr:tRNA guanosine(34) transglycosylase Tgt [Rhodothermales bacterium]
MHFELLHTDPSSAARRGRLHTPHGPVETPVFMPVGTLGTVKSIPQRALRSDIDAQIILANTYHLYLRPGTDVLESAGGLHTFMNWDRAVLTDSGGYQVFSLSDKRSISEDGVRFRSHLDGSEHLFTPESVVDTQRLIGADIIMVLDECPPGDVSASYARESNELTIRWAERSLVRFNETRSRYGHEQTLFGIVQGVVYADVRSESARRLVDLDFPGYAIGGLSVGETTDLMYEMVDVVAPLLPPEKPRYLMGVGTPANLLENIARGIDMFDCVMPTRNARNGRLYTTDGFLNVRNEKWKEDHSAIDAGLDSYASSSYSKAYLRHLFQSNEMLGPQLATLQNLSLYSRLMDESRSRIVAGTFDGWWQATADRLSQRL